MAVFPNPLRHQLIVRNQNREMSNLTR